MTVIAFRDGIMAADREHTWPNRVHSAVKIFQSKDYLIGGAGQVNQCEQVMRWIVQGGKETPPSFGGDKSDFDILVVHRDGRVLLFADSHLPIELKEDYTAIGSGAPVALGAMFCGANAITAVHAAIQHGVHCGGPVDVLKLPRTPPSASAPRSL